MAPPSGFDTISGVLPCYNEEENIETATRRMAEVVGSLGFKDWEVLIVDDGSVDSTPEIADRLAPEDPPIRGFHHHPNPRKAKALNSGLPTPRHPHNLY